MRDAAALAPSELPSSRNQRGISEDSVLSSKPGTRSGTESRGLPVSASYPGPQVGNLEARPDRLRWSYDYARDQVGNQVTLAKKEADARPVSGGCGNQPRPGWHGAHLGAE